MASPASPLLKVTGFSSLERVEDAFGSLMVDVGYVAAAGPGYVLVAPDDPDSVDLRQEEDREWLGRCVSDALRSVGENQIVICLHEVEPTLSKGDHEP